MDERPRKREFGGPQFLPSGTGDAPRLRGAVNLYIIGTGDVLYTGVSKPRAHHKSETFDGELFTNLTTCCLKNIR